MLSDNDLWKNDEIMAVNAEAGLTFDVLAKLCRAIESAVLEAQGKQEPAAWCFVQNGFTHYTDDKRDWYDAVGVEEVTPLYAAPVVQPETKAAGHWRKCHDIAEATNVALRKQIAELIAAAEGKK